MIRAQAWRSVDKASEPGGEDGWQAGRAEGCAGRLSQRVVNEPSTRAASSMMRCKQWQQQQSGQVCSRVAVLDSVNRCLESDGITA